MTSKVFSGLSVRQRAGDVLDHLVGGDLLILLEQREDDVEQPQLEDLLGEDRALAQSIGRDELRPSSVNRTSCLGVSIRSRISAAFRIAIVSPNSLPISSEMS